MIVEQWASDELMTLSGELTGRQWAGIVTIIKKELQGIGITELLASEDRPCSTSTYYGRWSKDAPGKKSKPGWIDRPSWMQALKWARRDYRKYLFEHGTAEAMQVLAKAAAPSARELERQVMGDLAAIEVLSRQMDVAIEKKNEVGIINIARALGATQLAEALPALARALDREWGAETMGVLVSAIGSIASPLNVDRQKASTGILDRAGEATATKQVVQQTETGEKVVYLDYSRLSPEELDEYIDNTGRLIEKLRGGDRVPEEDTAASGQDPPA